MSDGLFGDCGLFRFSPFLPGLGIFRVQCFILFLKDSRVRLTALCDGFDDPDMFIELDR